MEGTGQLCGRGEVVNVLFEFDSGVPIVLSEDPRDRFEEEEVMTVVGNVLEGLRELSSAGIRFGRLASENILLQGGEYRLCIVRELLEGDDSEEPLPPAEDERQKVYDLGLVALEMCCRYKSTDLDPSVLSKTIISVEYSRELKLLLKQILCPEVKPIESYRELAVALIGVRYKNKKGSPGISPRKSSPVKRVSPRAKETKIFFKSQVSPKGTNKKQVQGQVQQVQRQSLTSQVLTQTSSVVEPEPRMLALRRQREQYLLSELYNPN